MLTSAVDRLNVVQDRIAEACARASRPIDAVRLLAVTKTRTDQEIQEIYDLGLRAFGENRVTEALGKQSVFPEVEWHMVGHLQSNKAKDCLGFQWLHSLDKADTARALEKSFGSTPRRLNVLLEVNTGGEDAKAGVRTWDDLVRLVDSVAGLPHLTIRGLMTMAPFSLDERIVRPCFTRLRTWAEKLAHAFPDHDWSTLSMGMTNDLHWAIAEGSTLVRIGTALFEGFR